ncbi:MAG TPA: SPOR domain-containing protein [Gemmatimonadaceae bacterium]|jgi:cell division septation protein DedD
MKMHTFFLSGKAIAIVSGAFGACGMLLFVSGVLVGVRVDVGGPAHNAGMSTRSDVAPPPAVAPQAGPVAQPSAAATPAAATTPAPAAAVPTTTPAAPSAGATAGGAAIGTTADAGSVTASASWPFTSSSFAPSPAPIESAQVEQESAPLPAANEQQLSQPAPATPARRVMMGDVSMISFVAPSGESAGAASADAASHSHDVPAPAPRNDAQYLVQVGIFRVEQHAKELVDRLTNAGYRATITERQEGDRALHVVRVGRFTGIEAAEKVAAKIGGSEQLVASVVAAPR